MELPEVWKGAILGIVQGLTEFLPISSSGHLIASKEILGFQEAGLTFDVALHVATLAAVIFYFRKDILTLLKSSNRIRFLMIIALGTIPGVALGIFLSDWRDTVSPWFVVGGWTFSATYLLFSKGRGGETQHGDVSWWQGLGVGCAQALALFPGVSRAGSSITCGLWLGLSRESAAKFSFLLSIPIVSGAGLKKAYDLYKTQEGSLGDALGAPLIAGMVLSFLVGLGAIFILMKVLRGNSFHRFGWYNLFAAVAFGLFLFLKGS